MGKGKITIIKEEPKQVQKTIPIKKGTKNKKKYLNQQLNQQNKEQKSIKHLAICFPDSILEIPQTSPLRAYFISQIARISAIFKVNQIIILKDHSYTSKSENFNPSQYIARNLQYLQTPQYLRKYLFKIHPDLKNTGLMNPIQSHHHLRANEISEFREGVVLERPTKQGQGSWVDIGLSKQAKMNLLILPMTRVTLRLKNYQQQNSYFYEAEAVSKKTPSLQKSLYWGYDVRIANNFKAIFDNDQYDIRLLCNHSNETQSLKSIKTFCQIDLAAKSVLIFFPGMEDLGTLITKDTHCKSNKSQVVSMFHYCIELKDYGVKQLRLQEQLMLSLGGLYNYMK